MGYETTAGRAALALGVGAIAGATITFSGGMIFVIVVAVLTGKSVPWDQFFVGLDILIIAAILVVYLIGLFVIAAPIWWLLHRHGLRSPRHAFALGAIAAFCVRFAMDAIPALMFAPIGGYQAGDSGGDTIVNGKTTLHGWIEIFQASVIAAAVAAIVALVIWRIAYRPARQKG